MFGLTKGGLTGAALISAITLALLSAFVERVGPELIQYGDSVYKPVLKGGFPVAYLFDSPGVSRERQLAFGEDKVHMDALIGNVAFYFVFLKIVVWAISRRRSSRGLDVE